MKSTSLSLFLIFLHYVNTLNCNRTSLAACAISSILLEYYAKNEWKVDVINYGSGGKSEKIVDELLRNKKDLISFQVSKASAENDWKNTLNISSILLFDSPENFKEISPNIVWVNDVERRYKNLVYIHNATASDITGIEDGFSIDSTNFLVNDTGKSIDLVASFMFTPTACRSNQLVTINRFFNLNEMEWESSKFYPRKYQNLFDCKLVAGDLIGDSSDDGQNIVKALSVIFNFNLQIKLYEVYVLRTINPKQCADVDLILPDVNHGFIQSVTFHAISVTFAHPQGELYTQAEKMFIMFDLETWVAILVTFAISLAVIQVFNLLSVTIQNFVFGRYIRTPTMNLVSIFLNGAQHKVPGRNFARFLLTLFIIWSLIIRTCYQSKLFEFMQADKRKPPVKTIKDIVDSGFSVYFVGKTIIKQMQIGEGK